MNITFKQFVTLMLVSLLSITSFAFSAKHNEAQHKKFTSQEIKARQLWDNFVSNRKFRWSEYVDKLSEILKGQKKYEQFLSILKKNRKSKLRDLGIDINRELKRRNLEELEDLEEIEILWQPEDNKNLQKYYECKFGELPILLCERMDGKSKEECFNSIGA